MLRDQSGMADQAKEFLKHWGLKGRYVAERVDIDEQTLSRFLNHRLALSDNQLRRLTSYISEYERRNSI